MLYSVAWIAKNMKCTVSYTSIIGGGTRGAGGGGHGPPRFQNICFWPPPPDFKTRT